LGRAVTLGGSDPAGFSQPRRLPAGAVTVAKIPIGFQINHKNGASARAMIWCWKTWRCANNLAFRRGIILNRNLARLNDCSGQSCGGFGGVDESSL
jgi:hypothetical protein